MTLLGHSEQGQTWNNGDASEMKMIKELSPGL